MAQNISNLVDSYSDAKNRWLLRWSLWEAQEKKCYICGDPDGFVGTQIDHVIPQTERVDFNGLWAKVGGRLPNKGVHHISNLRACCSDCNSARIKGSKVLSENRLDLELQNSEKLMKAAFKVQADIRRHGDTAESLVRVATSDTAADFDLLWDVDLNQAVIAAFHVGSVGRKPIVRLYASNRRVSAHLDDESLRLLAAIQLVTGVSVSLLLGQAVERAIQTVDDTAEEYASKSYQYVYGVGFGTVDWPDHTDFSVSVADFEIGMQVASCVVTIEVNEVLSLPVSKQSNDGGKLEDQQTQPIRLVGTITVPATMPVGYNPSGKVGLDVWVDDDRSLEVSHS
ncbi:HNH endonuclease [Paenarthrobacter sp. TA1.8]|uniref:HNH endonuclease n=1 Tax=Paenarthrobacter sp. TA1.8 TaxID=3400219 RepID=UPI003B435232